MMSELDVATVIAETNKQLRRNQQIHPDDPILSNVVLNEHILNAQISAFNEKLENAVLHFQVIAEEQNRNAKATADAIADRLIANAGTRIEQQLNVVALQWERRLKQFADETAATNRRASLMAWCGALLIIISASTIAGLYLGNAAFNIMHPSKQRHRSAISRSKLMEASRMLEKRWVSHALVDRLIEMRKFDSATEVVSGSANIFTMLSKQVGDAIARVENMARPLSSIS